MKYVSCELAQHGICFMKNKIQSCCYSVSDWINLDSKSVLLVPKYTGENLDWESIFALIEERRANFKKGIIPKACENCYWLKEAEWEDSNYINNIYITHFTACNSQCIYCIEAFDASRNFYKNPYKILPILKDMKKREIMPVGSEFHIGGGEPTIYNEMDAIIKEFALSGFAKRISVPS